MTGTTMRKSKKTVATRVNMTAKVMREFRVTYADAVIPDMTNAQFQQVVNVRRLTWKSPNRLSLADAVKCYGQMANSYNEFRPGLIKALHCAFRHDGIEVTPAREYSVAVYLHVANVDGLRERVETFVRERFNADNVDWMDDDTLRVWWD